MINWLPSTHGARLPCMQMHILTLCSKQKKNCFHFQWDVNQNKAHERLQLRKDVAFRTHKWPFYPISYPRGNGTLHKSLALNFPPALHCKRILICANAKACQRSMRIGSIHRFESKRKTSMWRKERKKEMRQDNYVYYRWIPKYTCIFFVAFIHTYQNWIFSLDTVSHRWDW